MSEERELFESSFMVIEDETIWAKQRAELACLGGANAMEDGILLSVGHVSPETAEHLAFELVSDDLLSHDPFDTEMEEEEPIIHDPRWRDRELLDRRLRERTASDFELKLRGMSPEALDSQIARLEQALPRMLKASMAGKALAHSLAPHLIEHPLSRKPGVQLRKPRTNGRSS